MNKIDIVLSIQSSQLTSKQNLTSELTITMHEYKSYGKLKEPWKHIAGAPNLDLKVWEGSLEEETLTVKNKQKMASAEGKTNAPLREKQVYGLGTEETLAPSRTQERLRKVAGQSAQG